MAQCSNNDETTGVGSDTEYQFMLHPKHHRLAVQWALSAWQMMTSWLDHLAIRGYRCILRVTRISHSQRQLEQVKFTVGIVGQITRKIDIFQLHLGSYCDFFYQFFFLFEKKFPRKLSRNYVASHLFLWPSCTHRFTGFQPALANSVACVLSMFRCANIASRIRRAYSPKRAVMLSVKSKYVVYLKVRNAS